MAIAIKFLQLSIIDKFQILLGKGYYKYCRNLYVPYIVIAIAVFCFCRNSLLTQITLYVKLFNT